MKPFTKKELIATGLILAILFVITSLNMRLALRRARDAQRRADLGSISNGLNSFFDDFGFFPPSENGLIKACKADNFEEKLKEAKSYELFNWSVFLEGLRGCKWGEDSLEDLGFFDEHVVYLKSIPKDPKESLGMKYIYFSNTRRFQVYAYLEGEETEEGYNEGIVARGLSCGEKICSFGKSYATTPVDISIEEYERQLEEERIKSGK